MTRLDDTAERFAIALLNEKKRLETINADLLKALKWARDETDRFQSDGRIDWTDFYNRVTEAIDKAEGPS